MKKIKKIIFMITLILISIITTNNVKAAEDDRLFVNGEEFTSDKATINCGEGTATFNPETITLTLNNITITDDGLHDGWFDTPIYYSGDKDLTIVLKGTNTITLVDNKEAITAYDSNLTIEGTGHLNINMNDLPSDVISAKDVTIESAYLNVEIDMGNTDYGLTTDNGPWSSIIYARDGNILISNSVVSIYGPFHVGVLAESDDENGEVTITDSSVAIQGVGFTVTNDYSYNNDNYYEFHQEGIAGNHVVINGNVDLNILDVGYGIDTYTNYTSEYYDYYDDNSITINDGEINISASEYGMYTDNMNADNYNKKIIAGYYEDGTNADVVTKSDFSNYYLWGNYIKMGDTNTYTVKKVITNDIVDMPNEAFEGEPILVENLFPYAYGIAKVQILRTTDNSDITEEVGYNTKTHKFIMPSYPVTVKITTKVVYAAVPKTISAKLDKYNAVKVSWTRDDNSNNNYFDGCYIYYKKSTENTWKKITWTLKSYYTKTDLEPGVKYNFKIVPMIRFYNTNGKITNIESTKYKLINIFTLKKMNLPTVTKYNDSKVQVKWKKVEGASGYQIARSVYKTRNYSVVKTVNNKYIGYKLDTKANKTYYYKVRAYRLSNGAKVYGPWSNYKSFRLQ